MSGPVFVDSNVFVYRHDAGETDKQPRARAWIERCWEHRAGRVSFQVLHEFYQTVTRKLKPGLPRVEAREEVRDLLAWRPVPLDERVLDDAWRIEDRFQLSLWDSLIVAAARAAACPYLVTEDLQDGQDLGGVRVVNPFLHEPHELGLPD